MPISMNERLDLAYNLGFKVREYRYFLGRVFAGVNSSLLCYRQSIDAGKELHDSTSQVIQREVAFHLSALFNGVQTMKDVIEQITGSGLPWSTIEQRTRHGRFVYEARNAMTHDGHPIVTLWIDGCIHAPADFTRIKREKGREQQRNVPAPGPEIGQVCAEFSFDFASLLIEQMAAIVDRAEIRGPNGQHSPAILEKLLQRPDIAISEQARNLMRDAQPYAAAAYPLLDGDPTAIAVERLEDLARLCQAEEQRHGRRVTSEVT